MATPYQQSVDDTINLIDQIVEDMNHNSAIDYLEEIESHIRSCLRDMKPPHPQPKAAQAGGLK